jgi:glycosyltransferase involved in cell wall biosynthesis
MDLSILIPARNEEFLGKTIQNILENIEGKTEVIAVCDGYTDPIPELPQDPRVKVIVLPKSIGQRAATNLACKMSTAKYVMKCDAHVAFDKGFDVKMITEMQDDWTMVPTMRNLHAFDWVCRNGHRRYQGPSGGCLECGKSTKKEILWIGKTSPQSNGYRFDTDMHFQYWPELAKRQEGDIIETMSLQGSCFMLTREKYWELDICSEEFYSWGQQGVEVACKTWLSGGKVMVNKKTWYAHMFRTQGGDFSFPYEQSGKEVVANREKSKELFRDNKWPKAVHDFQWLLDRFNPPGWENKTKGILYYSDNRLEPKIMTRVQEQLKLIGLPITSVTLLPTDLGNNIVLPLERSYLTVAKQIVTGLESMKEDIVYFAEHDVLYPKEHFDFDGYENNVYYYNTNSWFLRAKDGHCLYYNHRSLSGMSCYRETALNHFKERVRRIEALIAEAEQNGGKVRSLKDTSTFVSLKEGIHRLGFEPGTHSRPDRIDTLPAKNYQSSVPTVDIKHGNNLTQARFRKDQFRNERSYEGWKESDEIPFWGKGRDII